MLKWFNKKKKDNKGFTLVELVIVVAILAILVGLLAPQYTKYVEKSRKAADASNMDEMVKVVKVFAADPANELAVGDYTITIPATGTASIKKDTTELKSTELYKEMEASIPGWTKTTTKSQKWSSDGKPVAINATVTVAADGGTSVKYYSGDTYVDDNTFETYMLTGSEKTKTTTD